MLLKYLLNYIEELYHKNSTNKDYIKLAYRSFSCSNTAKNIYSNLFSLSMCFCVWFVSYMDWRQVLFLLLSMEAIIFNKKQ
jgi:hypothetical protein